MIEKPLQNLIKSQGWKDGSTWEFDWYLDLIFCHAMAFGTHPIKINYIQPILDDEFINTNINDNIISRYSDFFRSRSNISRLLYNQKDILDQADCLIYSLKNDISELHLNSYYKVQYGLSLLMASVSVVFDKLIEFEIKNISKKNNVTVEILSNYIIEASSVTSLNKSNEKLLEFYINNKEILDSYYEKGTILPSETLNKLNEHSLKYGWINTGEKGKSAWSNEDFLTQLKNLVNSSKPKTKNISNDLKQTVKDIIQININDNVASDKQIELDYLFQNHLKIRLGNFYKENIIERLSFEEIIKCLKNPSEINNYSKSTENHRLAYPIDGKVITKILEENEYLEIKSLISTKDYTTLKIIGRSACQGIVKGYVKIVKNLKDLSDFKDGYILVAEKTQPSYIMTMRKAKAIVTDIGGITSHAAIVSREFNIPCIVATETASRTLVDGDYVEVDAIKGVVTKLNQI